MYLQSLWAVAAAGLFSLMAALIKCCAGHFSVFELVLYRSIFGMCFIAWFVHAQHGTLRTRCFWGHIKRSVLGTGSMALWFMTLGALPLSTNITLSYTTPLFMAANFIVLAALRHERAPWGVILAVIAGFAGIVIVLQPTFSSDMAGPALLCLTVSAIDLVTYWQIRQLGELKEPPWRIVFYFTVFGTLFGLTGTLLSPEGFHDITLENAPYLLGMCLCATVAQVCVTRSYACGNMLLSSCLGFSAIVFSTIFGLLLFHETLTAGFFIGAPLIICAGVFATLYTKRQEQREKEKPAPSAENEAG